MTKIPVLDHDAVLAAVSTGEAIERVREAFVSFARGEWQMPAKLYLPSPPNGDLGEALACDVVCTVTPGHEPVVRAESLAPGVHLNLMGADGPGKAEAELAAVERVLAEGRLFCDEWGQASHGGEVTGAVAAGLVRQEDVTELGAICAGLAPGRGAEGAITLFDSTGLAIQ